MKAFLSKLSQAFMLPIALLPAAGIMLGVGASFTNETFIAQYNLENVVGTGTILGSFLQIMNAAGGVVFTLLPLLFAIGVAVGFAKKEKGSAALAGFMGYMVMTAVISVLFTSLSPNNTIFFDRTFELGETSTFLGFPNVINMGVFGGIFSGAITVILHNRYINSEVPAILGFFGGPRLIPILATFSALFYGVLLAIIWPPIGSVLTTFGNSLVNLGETNYGFLASFAFGVGERALIPLGLHHIFYLPLWQTAVGGTYEFGGVMYYGTQNAFFGMLSAGGDLASNIASYPSTNFMTGKFPFMIFGLPGAAYAMYSVVDEENKKQAGGLLLSVALTSILTGITEPIEFTFLFLAPVLYYGFHIWMAGISFALMDILNVKVGMTFSGGLIDLTLYGILPGIATNWYYIVVVGLFMFAIYFFVFRWYILKYDIATPGRGGAAVQVIGKKEYKESKNGSANESKKGSGNSADVDLSYKVVEALGGVNNLADVDACITRLRVSVKDESKVAKSDVFTKELEALGFNSNGKAIQVIYGGRAARLKSIINEDILKV